MLTEGIGDFLSYQTTFLDSDNTLTTREDTAQIREVFERKKHNTIHVLDNEQEIHFPVKKSRTLLKRRDSQDFPIHLETHPQIAELNYLTTKILHIITPLMTTEHVQVPEPLGFTTHKASSQTGLVYRKID